MRRPAFPTMLEGRARIYVGRRPLMRNGRQVYKLGVPQTREVYGVRACVGARVDGDPPHAWPKARLQALWAVLPWRDGRIEWSYDPEHRALVVRWHSPVRRGRLQLFEVRVAT